MILRLNQLEKIVLIGLLRRPGKEGLRKGNRAEVRRMAGVLDALGADDWDADVRAVAREARTASLLASRGRADAHALAEQEAALASNALVAEFDGRAPGDPVEVDRADIEFLRDQLSALDAASELDLVRSPMWRRVMDRVDEACRQASDGKGRDAPGPVEAVAAEA